MTSAPGPQPSHASSFDGLLAALDPDREAAGRRFEDLRRRLVRFFDWRGALAPDECTDITLDRLATRIADGVEVHALHAYTFAIARLVFLEQARRPDAHAVSLSTVPDDVLAASPTRPNVWGECLDRGLDALGHEQRQLILRYYAHDRRDKIDDRAALARELGITVSALRNRAQRVRDRLEQMVIACVTGSETT